MCVIQLGEACFLVKTVPIGNPLGRIAVEGVAGDAEVKGKKGKPPDELPKGWAIHHAILWLRYVDDLLLGSRIFCSRCTHALIQRFYAVEFEIADTGAEVEWTDIAVTTRNGLSPHLLPTHKNKKKILGESEEWGKDSVPAGWAPYSVSLQASILTGRARRAGIITEQNEDEVLVYSWLSLCEFNIKGYKIRQLKRAIRRIPNGRLQRSLLKLLNLATSFCPVEISDTDSDSSVSSRETDASDRLASLLARAMGRDNNRGRGRGDQRSNRDRGRSPSRGRRDNRNNNKKNNNRDNNKGGRGSSRGNRSDRDNRGRDNRSDKDSNRSSNSSSPGKFAEALFDKLWETAKRRRKARSRSRSRSRTPSHRSNSLSRSRSQSSDRDRDRDRDRGRSRRSRDRDRARSHRSRSRDRDRDRDQDRDSDTKLPSSTAGLAPQLQRLLKDSFAPLAEGIRLLGGQAVDKDKKTPSVRERAIFDAYVTPHLEGFVADGPWGVLRVRLEVRKKEDLYPVLHGLGEKTTAALKRKTLKDLVSLIETKIRDKAAAS